MGNQAFTIAADVEGYWNMPLLHERKRAHESLRLGNFQYVEDFWFPKTLKQGDIIQALIPTQYDERFDEKELWPRNCLVLGFDIDRDTAEPQAVHLMKFSYNVEDHSTHELIFNPADHRFKIHGFRKSAVLRTGKIETVPFHSEHLNFYMNLTGWISDDVFPLFDKAMDEGYNAERHRFDPEHDVLGDTVCVPSLNPEYYNSKNGNFDLTDRKIGPWWNEIDSHEWENLLEKMTDNYLVRELNRADILRHEKAEMRQEQVAMRSMQREKRSFLNVLRHRRTTFKDGNSVTADDIEKILKIHADNEREVIPQKDDMWGDDAMNLRRSDIPELRDLLYRRFGIEKEVATIDVKAVFKQAIDPNSIKDLETLGVGGLLRDPDVSLPDQLWRGRYVTARIADLNDPENYGNAYRPCIVTKAYAKLNDEGQPVIAGLEMHPCTRAAHDSFSFKMPVHPYGWQERKANKQQTFLIADMVVRLPLEAQNFQSNIDSNFQELLPHMVEKFDRHIAHAKEARSGDLRVFGLEEIPEDWVEIELPAPPSDILQSKLSKWKKASFLPK